MTRNLSRPGAEHDGKPRGRLDVLRSSALHSPELNPIERLWLHLREKIASHCVVRTTKEIIDSYCPAWNCLLAETGRIRSLWSIHRSYILG
jgi:transposase